MDWLHSLLWEHSVSHTIFMLGIVIALGVWLGKIKIGGISLGVTWVLFIGLLVSHFGMNADEHIIHFIKEFGLILFVYSVGLQVGPGFFSSFKKDGMRLNALAATIVFIGVLMAVGFYYMTPYPISTIVGVLSGAITNTPGLGAAQEAYNQVHGSTDPTIALGYAAAYPLGVVGIILSTVLLRFLFRIKLSDETARIEQENKQKTSSFILLSIQVNNPAIAGKSVPEVMDLMESHFIISRIRKSDGTVYLTTSDTTLELDDILLVATDSIEQHRVMAFLGKVVPMDWDSDNSNLVSRRILVTKDSVNGKTLGSLQLRKSYGINITRINRAGVDFLATPSVSLQIGDRVMVVGPEAAVKNVEMALGNSLKRLDHPNLTPVFIGIALGVLLGSIPFTIPGIPQAVKLGLAGGLLIVSILIGRFGPKFRLNTYTTMSANLMLREVGITLFLACVGISSGEHFVETVFSTNGLAWIGMGFAITVVPLLIVGAISRGLLKMDYFEIIGLLAGSTTDPPALAYANDISNNDRPAIAYSTVYPVTMFLRVLTAQLLILIFA
ncbi:MAG: putative transporter [Bacteroidales bacterium]|nr:putative transporter [Bacteroidales bacterium]MDD4771432.1 putative transporter [Bacteroidales bacterium]